MGSLLILGEKINSWDMIGQITLTINILPRVINMEGINFLIFFDLLGVGGLSNDSGFDFGMVSGFWDEAFTYW